MCIVIIESPQSQSVCEGGTVEFTCVVMFPNGTTPTIPSWLADNSDTGAMPGHTASNNANGRSAPANVTTVLTVTNVTISSNGVVYDCLVRMNRNIITSNISVLTVLGTSYS